MIVDEREPDFDAKWAWEEMMHLLEEQELDWIETNNRDIEEYE